MATTDITQLLADLEARYTKLLSSRNLLKNKNDDDLITDAELKSFNDIIKFTANDLKIVISNKLESELKNIEDDVEQVLYDVRIELDKLKDKLTGAK